MGNTMGSIGGGMSGGKDFPVAPDGIYKCRLTSDSPKLAERVATYPEKGEVRELLFRWFFETTEVGDDEGKPFRFMKQTGRGYGDNRAHLTKLLDTMLGRRLTADEFNDLDLDELRQRDWSVSVGSETSEKDGKTRNNVNSVKPYESSVKPLKPLKPVQQAAPAPVASDQPDFIDDFDDPFADNAETPPAPVATGKTKK